ncbi:MAG: hypothetical protein M1828_005433 [Chrysothrix sp. TS-e1954]|nr:MAG: hypothetical protein M1828_005433 [Chrysothrix sp. TS-e1954]
MPDTTPNPKKGTTTHALSDPSIPMIKNAIPFSWDAEHPLSWDTSNPLSWNRAHPSGGPASRALHDPKDPGEGRVMIEKSIPFEWIDAGDEVCSWNRERKAKGTPPRETTYSIGEEGERVEMIRTAVPLSWDTNKPLSWQEEMPEGKGTTHAIRGEGEEEVEMIKRSIPFSWDPAHPLSWDPESQAAKNKTAEKDK